MLKLVDIVNVPLIGPQVCDIRRTLEPSCLH